MCRSSRHSIRFFYGVLLSAVFLTSVLWQLSRVLSCGQRSRQGEITDFQHQWCRLQKWRVDWKGMLSPCVGKTAWEQRQITWSLRTNAGNSYVSKWELQPAGHFSRFFIQSVTEDGKRKNFGGDSWRVYIRQGPSSLSPLVLDHSNGVYEVLFLVLEPGVYSAQIYLDYTLCDGFRDPPRDWFKIGTIDGKYQKDGVLGYIGDDYILQPLQGNTRLNFTIIHSAVKRGLYETCNKFTNGSCERSAAAVSCGLSCAMMWDGHGRWLSGQWVPYVKDQARLQIRPQSPSPSGTLWVFGDSVSDRFWSSIRSRSLCREKFEKCKRTYNWIYKLNSVELAKTKFDDKDFDQEKILKQIKDILSQRDMNREESVFLFNLGIHYSVSLNFTTYRKLINRVIQLLLGNNGVLSPRYRGKAVWKTSTAIEKEKVGEYFGGLNRTSWRFHTYQRVQLFHTYAVSAMCKAGIPVLDLYHLSASYPEGTLDHVHYPKHVFRSAEDLLEDTVTS